MEVTKYLLANVLANSLATFDWDFYQMECGKNGRWNNHFVTNSIV